MQPLQFLEISKFNRYMSAQIVTSEVQESQVGQRDEFGRYPSPQVVVVQRQLLQVPELAQFDRYHFGQLVMSEIQLLQVGQFAEFARYMPFQYVYIGRRWRWGSGSHFFGMIIKRQLCQAGQISEFRRYLSPQSVLREFQFDDAPVGVGSDAVPLPDWRLAQPVRVVLPVGAGRRVVQRRERRAVVHGYRRGRRPRHGFQTSYDLLPRLARMGSYHVLHEPIRKRLAHRVGQQVSEVGIPERGYQELELRLSRLRQSLPGPSRRFTRAHRDLVLDEPVGERLASRIRQQALVVGVGERGYQELERVKRPGRLPARRRHRDSQSDGERSSDGERRQERHNPYQRLLAH